MTLIHVDRARRLQAGMELVLDHDGLSMEHFPQVHEKYPGGIAFHGHRFMFTDSFERAIETAGTTREAAYRVKDFLIEQVFEAVRLESYPDCLSRFQVIFAVAPQDYLGIQHKIAWRDDAVPLPWLIESPHTERRDMTWLREGSFASPHHDAHQYWQGNASHDPYWEYLCAMPVRVVAPYEDTT